MKPRTLVHAGCLVLVTGLVLSCALPERVEIDSRNPGFVMPETPVVVFFVDGLHRASFEAMAAAGRLPLLKRYLLDRGATVENAITSAPSATFSNATAMVTGMFPSHHGVVGNRWFDRNRLIIRNYESASTMAEVNQDIRTPTIYELLEDQLTCAIGAQAHRGVRLQIATGMSTGGTLAGIALWLGNGASADEILVRKLYELTSQCRRLGRWPQFVLVHLPGVDDTAHSHGHEGEEYQEVLESLDASLGGVLRSFDEGGMLERMIVVLTADHGHHRIDDGQHFQIASLFTDGLGLSVINCTEEVRDTASYVDRKELFDRVRVVFSENGGRQCHLHLRLKEEWAIRPTLGEILMFHRRFGISENDPGMMDLTLPDILLRQPAIEYVAVRDGSDRVLFYGKNGTGTHPQTLAAIERERPEGQLATYRYRLIDGDPLGYLASPSSEPMCHGGSYLSLEWLEATAKLDRPDVIPQLVDVFDSQHSGDVVIFAAARWSLSDNYRGAHGGLLREEMVIPLYFAGGGIKAGMKVPYGRLVDLTPTVMELMGFAQRLGQNGPMDGVSRAAALRGDAPKDDSTPVIAPEKTHPAPAPETVPSPDAGAGGAVVTPPRVDPPNGGQRSPR